MRFRKDGNDQLFLCDDNDEHKFCGVCGKEMNYKEEDWFYVCSENNIVICKSCQLDPKIKKICPTEWTSTDLDKPHIHLKCIGIEVPKKSVLKAFLNLLF